MLAQELSKFPQECMLHDRECAYVSSFDNTSSEEALLHEFKTGVEIFEKESIKGLFFTRHLISRVHSK